MEQMLREIVVEQPSMLEKEKILLEKGTVCEIRQLGTPADILGHLKNIDVKALQTFITSEFYNPAVLKLAMCIAESIYYNNGSDIANTKMVKTWFTSLRQFGAESVSGYALQTSFDNVPNFFVLKSPRDVEDAAEDLLHEYIVGVYGTNKLRAFNPNFSYILGGFKCSPPTLSRRTKMVTNWCNPDHAVNYVLYENIFPSEALKDFVKDENRCGPLEFISAYLQIVLASAEALKLIDFTHYDLHNNNVLLRTVEGYPSFYIPYKSGDGHLYIKCHSVSTIIDYGSSHFVYDGQAYGKVGLEGYGVEALTSNIWYDVYKLLGFCLYDMKLNDTNLRCYGVAKQLMTFFDMSGLTDVDQLVKEERDDLYLFHGFSDDHLNSNIGDYINFILNNYPNIDEVVMDQPPAGSHVLGCDVGACITDQLLIRQVLPA
jgi:hypothetical protein